MDCCQVNVNESNIANYFLLDSRVRNFEFKGVINKKFEWNDCTTHEMQICLEKCVTPSDLLSILLTNCHSLKVL